MWGWKEDNRLVWEHRSLNSARLSPLCYIPSFENLSVQSEMSLCNYIHMVSCMTDST